MAYNLQQCQKINTAEESKTDDDDDGKIIYLNMDSICYRYYFKSVKKMICIT